MQTLTDIALPEIVDYLNACADARKRVGIDDTRRHIYTRMYRVTLRECKRLGIVPVKDACGRFKGFKEIQR